MQFILYYCCIISSITIIYINTVANECAAYKGLKGMTRMKRYIFILVAILAICTVFLTACGKEEANTPADDETTIVDGENIVGDDMIEDATTENPDEYPEIASFYGLFAPDEESVCRLIQEYIPEYDNPYSTETKAISSDSAKKLVGDVQIMTLFTQDHGVTVGNITYSPAWIYEHTTEDYKTAGITPQDLRELIDYYSEYKDSEEAKKLAVERMQQLKYISSGVLTYSDDTIRCTGYFPMVMKEFAVVGSVSDSELYFYLVDNNPDDGDDNIYIAMYMDDQLMAVGYDTLEGYDLMGRFFSESARRYDYADAANVPVGTVIRLAWSGTAEQSSQEGVKYLSWISRFQFSGSECAYTEEQLAEYAKRAEDFPFDKETACAGCEGMTQYVDLVNGEVFLSGLVPYEPVTDFSELIEELTNKLDEKADVKEGGYSFYHNDGKTSKKCVECDYAMSEKEIYLFKSLSGGGENPYYFSSDVLSAVGYPEEFYDRALINYLEDYVLISYGLPKVDGLDYVKLFRMIPVEEIAEE